MDEWLKVPFVVDKSSHRLLGIIGLRSEHFNARACFFGLPHARVRGTVVSNIRSCPEIEVSNDFDTLEQARTEADKILFLFFHDHHNIFHHFPLRYEQDFQGWSYDEVIDWLRNCGAFDVKSFHKIEVK